MIKGKTRVAVLVTFLVMACGTQAFGGGFALYEFSSRGNAQGMALVARADDPSAVAFNPAGITQLEGVQGMVGVSTITPSVDVSTTNPYTGLSDSTSTESNLWVPPHAYLTAQLNDRYWLGVGVFSRFGLGTEFDEDWPGRYNSYFAGIQSASVNPNLAVKITDDLSLAFGVEAMWFNLDLRTTIDGKALLVAGGALPPSTPVNNPDSNTFDIQQDLTGDCVGYGFNAGLFYKPCDYASVGVSYRSQVDVRVRGEADFDKSAMAAATLPASFFKDTSVYGEVTLPDMVFMGLAVYPTDKLSIEADAIFNRWSTYDQLTFNYGDPLYVTAAGGVDSVTRDKKWKDTWRFQFGVEYAVTDWLDLRGGLIIDESPINDDHVDYLLPSNDQMLYSAGAGFKFGDWTLDLSYVYLAIKDRDVDARVAEGVLEGEFTDGDAHIMGASVGYKF